MRYGIDCATRMGEHWWIVGPLSPACSRRGGRRWVPGAPWIGITRGRTGELILASADQTVVVPDVGARRVIARFPATVWPSRRVETDECSPLAAGRDG